MKILYIITGLRIGGAEKLLYQTCKWLSRRYPVEIYVIYFDPYAPMLPLFEDLSVKIVRFDYNMLGFIKLTRYIYRRQFNIVHTHLIHADIMGRLAAWIVSLFFNNAIFSTAHGTEWFRWQKGLFCTFVRFIDRLLSLPSHSIVISISNSVRNILIQNEKIKPGKTINLYNSVEIPLKRENILHDKSGNSFLLLFLGRLAKEKNVSCLIKALNELKDLDIHVTIAGEGKCENELRELVFEFRLEDNVSFLRPVLNTDPLFRQNHVLVLPSLNEGLGMVVLEAFGHGLPVIGSRVDGITELLENDRGMLFESNNHIELANCIRKLYENKYLYSTYVENAYKYVSDFHDIRDYTNKLYNFYLSALRS